MKKETTLYDIVMTESNSEVISKDILSRDKAEEELSRLSSGAFGGVSYRLSQRKILSPIGGKIPKVGEFMYVPSFSSADCKREGFEFVKRIRGGLAQIASVGVDNNNWNVTFNELAGNQVEYYGGNYTVRPNFNFNSLKDKQEIYQKSYRNRVASLEVDVNAIKIKDGHDHYADIMADWDSWK